jgi:hypothetical protein
MKKFRILLIVLMACVNIFGQPYNRHVTLNPNSGYVSISEIACGYGLGTSTAGYSKQYFGFTTMHGYQLNFYGLNVNSNLQGGLGAGILFYSKDYLFPLYFDLRISQNKKQVSIFFFGDAGFLISVKDFNAQTRLFINGGSGVRLKLDDHISVNVAPGLFIQMGTGSRDSFRNLKAGISFKPR